MSYTDTRRVRKDYWYTSAQIVDVGSVWAQASLDRVFLYSNREITNRTALELSNIPDLNTLPKKILLPLNKGNNHWTAIAITLTEIEDHTVNINISFTDSINTNTELKNLDVRIRNEITRIETIFRQKYSSTTLNIISSVYPHTWRQPDGSSCGPYSLANGARCLDGKGHEANPGRKVIREQQLNMMTQSTAIAGCSTNNFVDEILLDWIIDQTENGKSIKVTTPEDVNEICIYYANKHNRNVCEVVNIFHDEYCSRNAKPWFRPNLVNTRLRELIGEYGIKVASTLPGNSHINKQTKVSNYQKDYSDLSFEQLIKIFKANENVQQKALSIAAENISKKIDNIRIILSDCTSELHSLELMEQITLAMQKANHEEAEKLIKDALVDEHQKTNLDTCLGLVSDIIGARRFAKENDEKFIYLASAYKTSGDAMKMIKQMEIVNFHTPKEILEAHLQLLQGAIERNNASAIRQVNFAISDFFSMLFEFLTGGFWEADITRIERINKNFKDNQGNISSEMLQQEQKAIEIILDTRKSLEKEFGRSEENNSIYTALRSY